MRHRGLAGLRPCLLFSRACAASPYPFLLSRRADTIGPSAHLRHRSLHLDTTHIHSEADLSPKEKALNPV